MHDPKPDQKTPGTEAGFALILAMMALVLMTFLGLTLATTTSTELQIATNYRYSQMAYYAAESGIEIGKRYLRQTDWRAVLPPARAEADMGDNPEEYERRTGPEGEPTRNLEQAEVRSRRGPESRGSYAGRAALEMAHVFRHLGPPQGTNPEGS